MLELKNISKSYKVGDSKWQVLKDISIKFRKNEFASILGASGSGKTTLLNIIGGLDKYDDGDLVIEGTSTKKYKDKDWDTYRNYRVGFIFQSYNLISHQSVLSNVEIALTLSGVSKRERRKRAKEALEKVGLKEHINKKPNQLSGGQMQRVAIARAIVNDPEIILADEPTGALDSKTSVQIMELLKEISKDKLVIMVTHNPELAKVYSTRIIELKDGEILEDNNPYDGSGEEAVLDKGKKKRKTSMSLFTSLGLSFNNLLTKKGRTFLTAFAGSIGIIGIALILSLSHGVNDYVADMERESLSNFPIVLEKTTYNFENLLSLATVTEEKGKDNVVTSKDDITSQLNLMTEEFVSENDLKSFKKYIEENQEINDYVTEIEYGYNLDLQIYSTKNDNYTRVNPNNFNVLSGKIGEESSEEGINLSIDTTETPVFQEMLDNKDVLNSKYDVVSGRLPEEYNELVLVVGNDNIIPDSVLYALDIKDRREVTDILNRLNSDEDVKIDSTEYSYDDLLNLSYKLILNTDYYKYEDGMYRDYSNDSKYMKKIIDNGLDIKVVGILRNKENNTDSAGYIGYKHSLTEYVINNIAKTDIYKAQTENKDINVLTGEKFDELTNTYEQNCKLLGIADLDDPYTINIYPKDFDNKEKIIAYIDEYNNKQEDKSKVVNYTDLIKTVISGVTSIINMVSILLIGFVAISLIVSSIMIAIITYISVLERTKEIGILRAIGASKKDVSRVFRAETMIEGLIAGLLGIGISLAISSLINVIVKTVAGIDKIASLPLSGAIILILLSVLLNVIAGHIPSKMASKKDPVEALRSE